MEYLLLTAYNYNSSVKKD